MKRTFISMLLVGTSCAAFAQEDSTKINSNTTTAVNGNTMNTSGEYNAYSAFNATAPAHVNVYLQRDYPTAADVRWRQMEDWWHGYYMDNGQPAHIYYNNAGNTFRVALPVKQSLIPDDVVSKAVNMFGPTIYDITTIKGSSGQDVYHVRVIDNGTVSSQYIGADGSKVLDIYRVENTDPMLNTNTNTNLNSNTNTNLNTDANSNSTDLNSTQSNNANAEMDNPTKVKIKTETSDGKEIKTKIKNGKVKTKKDD